MRTFCVHKKGVKHTNCNKMRGMGFFFYCLILCVFWVFKNTTKTAWNGYNFHRYLPHVKAPFEFCWTGWLCNFFFKAPPPGYFLYLCYDMILYCRGPPHMGLRDYGGLRTGGGETEGLRALGRLNATVTNDVSSSCGQSTTPPSARPQQQGKALPGAATI